MKNSNQAEVEKNMKITKKLAASLVTFFLLWASGASAEDSQIVKDLEAETLSLSCSLSMTQSWFHLPQGSSMIMDLEAKTIQYNAAAINILLTPEASEDVLLESDNRWDLVENNSIALSPNLNNFRVKLKKTILYERRYLTFDLLVVHRNLKNNLVTRVSYPVTSTEQTISVYLEHVFGHNRLSVGTRQQSIDDMDEGIVFSEQNPGVTLTGECKVIVTSNGVSKDGDTKSEF